MKIYWLSCLLLLVQACKDDEALPGSGSLDVQVSYAVDGSSLRYDTLAYTNDAGNTYSVYRLQYFLTGISLIRSDSSLLPIRSMQYMDASDASTRTFSCYEIPNGEYIGVLFNTGVDASHNVHGGLPNNVQCNNMEWPEAMGGGYHFLKLEGHFTHNDTLYGFNMHLGTNDYLVHNTIYTPLHIQGNMVALHLVMNINEWFRNPYVFDFNSCGNYTMGDTSAMHKLCANGADIFSVE